LSFIEPESTFFFNTQSINLCTHKQGCLVTYTYVLNTYRYTKFNVIKNIYHDIVNK